MSGFAEIRAAAQRVARQARFVRIDSGALERLAGECRGSEPTLIDPAHHHLASPAETLAYVVTLDAINFGSGWFPLLHKRPGLSGYFTVATALKERFEHEGAFTASGLGALDADAVSEMLGQPRRDPGLRELMEHFARALPILARELGAGHAQTTEAREGVAAAEAALAAGLKVEMIRWFYSRSEGSGQFLTPSGHFVSARPGGSQESPRPEDGGLRAMPGGRS